MQVGFCGKFFEGIQVEVLHSLAVKNGFESFSLSSVQAKEIQNSVVGKFKPNEVCWHYTDGISLYETARVAVKLGADILVIPAEVAEYYKMQLFSIVNNTDLMIALENGYGGHDISPYTENLYSTVGSTAQELKTIVDLLNNQVSKTRFFACLNVGHAILCDEKPDDFVREIKDRLISIHVNDNHKRNDYHLMPLRGRDSMKWQDFFDSLHETKFDKVIYIDANGRVAMQSEKLAESWIKLLYDIGKYIQKEVELQCR